MYFVIGKDWRIQLRVIQDLIAVNGLFAPILAYQLHAPFIGEIGESTRRGDGFRHGDWASVWYLALQPDLSIDVNKAIC